MVLTHVQQELLSFFNLVHVAPLSTAMTVFEQIVNKVDKTIVPKKEELCKEILNVNSLIKNYDLEIVECVDEVTSGTVFVIINTADNNVTQKSKFYEKNVTQLFSKIVRTCMLSEEGHISEIDSLNLSSHAGMTKTAAQSVLGKLIKDKWLVSKNGIISLGIRSIIELEPNLKQLYPNEIQHCPFCKLVVIQGYVCTHCKIKCHYACCTKYSKRKSNCICPKCKKNWSDLLTTLNIKESEENNEINENNSTSTKYFGSSDHIAGKKRKHLPVEK